jgi:hypothetical protein
MAWNHILKQNNSAEVKLSNNTNSNTNKTDMTVLKNDALSTNTVGKKQNEPPGSWPRDQTALLRYFMPLISLSR